MDLKIPESLRQEHQELKDELAWAVELENRTGEAARAVADLFRPHSVKEEEFVLPPLALLPALSSDRVPDEVDRVLAMTDRLEAELPRMVAEHEEIRKALDRLAEAADKEGHWQAVDVSKRLRSHARIEEEVLYPAAVLIGKYLKAWRDRAY